MIRSIFSLSAALALAASASAVPIQINFASSSGTAAPDFYNDMTTDPDQSSESAKQLLGSLKDASNITTDVSLWFITDNGFSSGVVNSFSAPSVPGVPDAVADSVLFLNGNSGSPSATYEFRGLVADALYDLSFLSSSNASRTATIVGVGGSTVSINPTGNTSFTEFANVQASSGGVIAFTLAKVDGVNVNSNSSAILNALRIEAVPEPASLALIGLGGLLMMPRRRAR